MSEPSPAARVQTGGWAEVGAKNTACNIWVLSPKHRASGGVRTHMWDIIIILASKTDNCNGFCRKSESRHSWSSFQLCVTVGWDVWDGFHFPISTDRRSTSASIHNTCITSDAKAGSVATHCPSMATEEPRVYSRARSNLPHVQTETTR